MRARVSENRGHSGRAGCRRRAAASRRRCVRRSGSCAMAASAAVRERAAAHRRCRDRQLLAEVSAIYEAEQAFLVISSTCCRHRWATAQVRAGGLARLSAHRGEAHAQGECVHEWRCHEDTVTVSGVEHSVLDAQALRIIASASWTSFSDMEWSPCARSWVSSMSSEGSCENVGTGACALVRAFRNLERSKTARCERLRKKDSPRQSYLRRSWIRIG